MARTRGLAALAIAAGVALAIGVARPAAAQPDDDSEHDSERGGEAEAAPRPADRIDGDRIDQTMQRSLDDVYQREMPLGRGDYGGSGLGGPDGPGDPGGGSGAAGSAGPGGVPGGGGSNAGVPGAHGPGSGSAGGAGNAGSAGGSAGAGSAGSAVANPEDHDGTARLPNGTPGDPRRRPGRSSRGHGGGGGTVDDDSSLGSIGGIAKIMLWGLIAIIAVMIIVFVIRQASGMTGEVDPVASSDDAATEDPNRIRAVVERPRDDADQLAHEGRFAEAIHTLLLRTVHELASQNLVRVTPSMTSREVLARVPMLGDARAALADLVTAVEVTWFGDDVPGEADYARCRAQFELFAAAYRRGAAAAQGPGAPAVLHARSGQGAA